MSIERIWRLCHRAVCALGFYDMLGNLLYTLKANLPYATHKGDGGEGFVLWHFFLSGFPSRACLFGCNKDFRLLLNEGDGGESFSILVVYRRKISLPGSLQPDGAEPKKRTKAKREISLNLLISIFRLSFLPFCRLKMKSYFIALCTFLAAPSAKYFFILPRGSLNYCLGKLACVCCF